MNPPRDFLMPAQLVVGAGALDRLGGICAREGWRKALIVSGGSGRSAELVARVTRLLEEQGVGAAAYTGVDSEPVLEHVQAGLRAFVDGGCDVVIGLGGGSPLDTAKAVAAMAGNPGSIAQYRGVGALPAPGAPIVAVPTTAGTGSEVTIYTVVTDQQSGVKMLIGSPYLIPRVAVVDPLLTVPCPPGLTAATGVDALVHAIEAFVSVKRQPLADLFCRSAISLIAGSIRQAWANGANLAAREQMMLGATQAGIAFSNSSVALVHGMSRPIGAHFHVAHGVANAALLAPVTAFSLVGDPLRYGEVARLMGEPVDGRSPMDAADQLVRALRRLTADIRIPSLRALGVPRERLLELAPSMADAALASGSPGNNPRQPTRDEIIELYQLAYDEGPPEG